MKITTKFVVAFIILITSFLVIILYQQNQRKVIDSGENSVVQEKSDQAKAEEYAEEMKPKIEEEISKTDIHDFVKNITFNKSVTINPMGDIKIKGFINSESGKFKFSALLQYNSGKVDSMSYSPDLADRFRDWEKYKNEPELKENFLKRLPKKEREQYLKDIGEKE